MVAAEDGCGGACGCKSAWGFSRSPGRRNQRRFWRLPQNPAHYNSTIRQQADGPQGRIQVRTRQPRQQNTRTARQVAAADLWLPPTALYILEN